MGRRKVIDRDMVLEAAEQLVARHGSSALTIQSVAMAAGITKGGVQSCFESKEVLIKAMLRRWMDIYQAQMATMVGSGSSSLEVLAAHIKLTAHADDSSNSRAAGLTAALLQSPEHLDIVREWYAQLLEAISVGSPSEVAAKRFTFFATEGLFFLRYLGLMQMDRAEWEASFEQLLGHTAKDSLPPPKA